MTFRRSASFFAAALCVAAVPAVLAQSPAATMPTNATPVVVSASEAFPASGFPFVYLAPEDSDLDTEIKTLGYDAATESWIYEKLPNAETAPRLSLGALGTVGEHVWRKRYRPQPLPRHNNEQLNALAGAGLPLALDLAIPVGSHAHMTFMDGVKPHQPCWAEPNNDAMLWSVCSEEGVEFWTSIWTNEVSTFQLHRGRFPEAARLWTNARVDDTASASRAAIARMLRQNMPFLPTAFTSIAGVPLSTFASATRMNARTTRPAFWALYTIGEELCFNHAVAAGATALTPIPVWFQVDALPATGIDLARASKACGLLAAPNLDEHPIFTAHYLRAIANGKPVLAPNMTPSANSASLRSEALARLARGYAAAPLAPSRRYPRTWLRYGKDPKTGRTALDAAATEARGRELAAARPNEWMNPYAVAPAALVKGLADARAACNEALPYFDYALPRDAAPVMLLQSRSSERIAAFATATTNKTMSVKFPIESCVDVLQLSFLPFAILPETSLEDDNTNAIPSNVRALIATAATPSLSDAAYNALTNWVSNGGTLFWQKGALERNEYYRMRRDVSLWEQRAESGERSAEFVFGEGRIVLVDDFETSAEAAAAFEKVYETVDVKPLLSLADAATNEACIGLEAWLAPASAPLGADGKSRACLIFNRTSETINANLAITGAAPILIDIAPRDGKLVFLPLP